MRAAGGVHGAGPAVEEAYAAANAAAAATALAGGGAPPPLPPPGAPCMSFISQPFDSDGSNTQLVDPSATADRLRYAAEQREREEDAARLRFAEAQRRSGVPPGPVSGRPPRRVLRRRHAAEGQ